MKKSRESLVLIDGYESDYMCMPINICKIVIEIRRESLLIVAEAKASKKTLGAFWRSEPHCWWKVPIWDFGSGSGLRLTHVPPAVHIS